jgi:hypothetical protein
MTPKLAARIAELMRIQGSYKAGGVDLWCRCQDANKQEITASVTPGGGTATVDFGWGKMDFLMVVQDGALLLDDT